MEKHFKVTIYLSKLISYAVRVQERQMDAVFLGTYSLLSGKMVDVFFSYLHHYFGKKKNSGSNIE